MHSQTLSFYFWFCPSFYFWFITYEKNYSSFLILIYKQYCHSLSNIVLSIWHFSQICTQNGYRKLKYDRRSLESKKSKKSKKILNVIYQSCTCSCFLKSYLAVIAVLTFGHLKMCLPSKNLVIVQTNSMPKHPLFMAVQNNQI